MSSTATSPAATDSLRMPSPAVMDMAGLTNRRHANGTRSRGSCRLLHEFRVVSSKQKKENTEDTVDYLRVSHQFAWVFLTDEDTDNSAIPGGVLL